MMRGRDVALEALIEEKLEVWMGLKLNREKTRVVELREEGASLEFLGYLFRWDRDRHGRAWKYLNVSPSKKSIAREREPAAGDDLRVAIAHAVAATDRAAKPTDERLGELLFEGLSAGRLLRAGLVRAVAFHATSATAGTAPVSTAEGRALVFLFPTPGAAGAEQLALVSTRACPRRELVEEPDAGNPHVRFDERGGYARLRNPPLLYRLKRNSRRICPELAYITSLYVEF